MKNNQDRMVIHIVHANSNDLLDELAENLQNELCRLGYQVDIGHKEEPQADINHYICDNNLKIQYDSTYETVRTVLVTYSGSMQENILTENQMLNNLACICMSKNMMHKLILLGISENKIYYINPVCDDTIAPRKITLGITNRCYHQYDLRKRDDLILQVCRQLEPEFFKLKIMGSGWDDIVEQLRDIGYEVEYNSIFDRSLYRRLMPSLDYWIYYGFDEGAMGYLDALAAGVKTIVTPQGFHLDTSCGPTFSCETIKDFTRVLQEIQNEKKQTINAVKEWTWGNYAKKHLEIWQKLMLDCRRLP